MSKEEIFHFSSFLFMYFHLPRLQTGLTGGIMAPFGETGGNPVRGRRRQMHKTELPHPGAAAREQAIGTS